MILILIQSYKRNYSLKLIPTTYKILVFCDSSYWTGYLKRAKWQMSLDQELKLIWTRCVITSLFVD